MSATLITVTIDGMDYAVDFADLTANEVGVLKRVGHIAGANDVFKALLAHDLEVVVALAAIAMKRAGVAPNISALLDQPMSTIKVRLGEEASEDPTGGAEETTPAPDGTPVSLASTE